LTTLKVSDVWEEKDMSTTPRTLRLGAALFVVLLVLGLVAARHARAQSAQTSRTSAPRYLVEWVYRTKWGYKDEFFDIFKKYQVPVLDREKQLGYIIDYTIYTPGLHTSEDARWEYRIVITYKDQASSSHGNEVTKQLFPDQATLKREENRRWELTVAHWDLPIRIVDPHAAE
jgi:hypothetical protein